MVRLSCLLVGACAVFQAVVAIPAPWEAEVDNVLVKRSTRTVSTTFTGVKGHTHTPVHTISRGHAHTKKHHHTKKTKTTKTPTTKSTKTPTTTSTSTPTTTTTTTDTTTTTTTDTTTTSTTTTDSTTSSTIDSSTSTTTTSNTPTTTTTTTSTTTTTTTSSPTATNTNTPGTCPYYAFNNDVYTDSAGDTYNIACGFAIAGTPIQTQSSPNFGGCFALCDNNPSCVAFNWVPAVLFTPAFCQLYNIAVVLAPSLITDAAYQGSPIV